MSLRSSDVNRPVVPVPHVRFDAKENERLTSFSDLVLFQALFERLKLRQKLETCFEHFSTNRLYQPHVIFQALILQILMGFRCLRDRDYSADDPLVCRLLGVKTLPDVSTISRTLAELDEACAENVRNLSCSLVLDCLGQERLPRLTLDFDGSVLSTHIPHPQFQVYADKIGEMCHPGNDLLFDFPGRRQEWMPQLVLIRRESVRCPCWPLI